MQTRRRFLRNTARATAGIAAARALGFGAQGLLARLQAEGNPLRAIPEFAGGDLTAAEVSLKLWSDSFTRLWTLNGSYPSPTIRVRRGAEFSARLVNNLNEPTILHWHGIFAPAAMDGHPRSVVAPGGTFDYRFTVNQRAGTYWYHPHPDMHTGEQVYRGMAGFFIVGDDEEDALALPGGEFDVPLLIQDRNFSTEGELLYELDEATMMSGVLGSTILVNGTLEAVLGVSRDLYRIRLLNGSNARVYRLALSDTGSFHIIGTDGGLLDAPVEATEVWLSPGERAELLIDFSGRSVGTSATLRSLAFGSGQNMFEQGWPFDILRFDVTAEARRTATVPQTLATVERLDPSQSLTSRTFFLAADSGPNGSVLHTINGQAFGMDRVDVQVEVGTVEQWTFRNFTGTLHPMHMHGAAFQVLSRNNDESKVRPEERGWKDTVLVEETSSTEVLVKFGLEPGLFLVHCHNLEHEDHGMMSNVQIGAVMDVDDRNENHGSLNLDLH